MKTLENEFEEMIDVIVKLTWNCTIFRAFFEKNDANRETRRAHPEFFLTMHDSLLCSFCTATAILFEEKAKATSLWSLIKKSKPKLKNKLGNKIRQNIDHIKKIETLRHQVFAHRWQAKSPQDVLSKIPLRVGALIKITNLARFVILELAGEIDQGKKEELEKQQLSRPTLESIAAEVAQLMRTFWESPSS